MEAGEFIWYHPWIPQHGTFEQALYPPQNPRAGPPDQPTSYVFEPEVAFMDYMSEEKDVNYDKEP